ncbi:alpha/beta fold hydrolase [Staphylococcus chromogenes]|nr:alpha/beta fold hydrolase [Staphylococcus chromogenes]
MRSPLSPHVLALDGPFRHEWVHTRGTRLHAATAGEPNRPLVLLLHDALGGWFDYQQLIPMLSADFHVAAATARGFGQSDKPPSGYSIRYAVGDASGLIRALGHSDALVVAHGSATKVATTLAANYAQRVIGLVLLDCPRNSRLWDGRRKIGLARACDRFPHSVAARSLHGISASDLVELRAQSYRIGGTHSARVKHAKLLTARLPLNWQAAFVQPREYLAGMPQVTNPEEVVAAIHRVRAT